MHQRGSRSSTEERRIFQKSSASGVASWATATLSVLSEGTRSRSRINKMHAAEIDRLSSRLEEEFAMIAEMPPGVRWGDLEL